MPPKRPLPQKRACDVCYQRKIHCTFSDPDSSCEWCVHRDLECTFNRERPRKKRRNSLNTSDLETLSRRVDQLEKALSHAQPLAILSHGASTQNSIEVTDTNLIGFPGRRSSPGTVLEPTNDCISPTNSTSAKYSVSISQLGPNWYFEGIPISSEAGFQWISTRTGQTVTGTEFRIPGLKSSFSEALRPSISSKLCELPEQEVTRKILTGFFGSSFRLEFPVLNQDLFEKTIEVAYGPVNKNLISPGQTSARACVLGAISFASCQHTRGQIPLSVDVESCAAEAHRLILNITGDMGLDTLQTALLLGLQRTFHGHWQDAAFFHSIACRIVCSLKGHITQSTPQLGSDGSHLKEGESHHIRVLFWLCYMLDKDISLRTGNPPLLIDDYCDLDPLDTSTDYFNYLPSLSKFPSTEEKYENIIPFLLADPHLSRLKEKVYLQLYSARAMKDNDNQLLLHIRELDDQIECWRSSIPINFRPALSVSQTTPPNPSEQCIPYIIRCMSLQLDYHHLVTIIHTTVRKCTVDSSDGVRDLHDVVHSSFDLSLEASRSTFWCLRVLIEIIAEDAFRFITAYSTTAATSLFLNIVIHPLDKQAQRDLELLISAANMIRNMPMVTLTQRETNLIQETASFVMRLVWLGSCAMTKAEREINSTGIVSTLG
ncbi:hypothetical protein N7494_002636 [Penicillium frequentans]|uniref:Zn(2)-C6 fungal-type domain-containing protein n=1 Tax=Penicillium frequentans TaxID=3151616 RepID=A0AAD6GK35_9EURO|nr:hypothetical protein N7494_002636 [Penicillium glabrum]